MSGSILYHLPERWIAYDARQLLSALVEAKAAVSSLKTIPYQKRWVESLQRIELKREVAGTSRIEGAEFTERELDDAINAPTAESAPELFTRSQRQASAAVSTYRWISQLPSDRPIDADLVLEIHRRMVTGADDDRCDPGVLRKADQNVSFGSPRHRGASGGDECAEAFRRFVSELQQEFPSHDPLLQAVAAHYHLAAMHPFLDGNGRTARALEALFLQRAGLRDAAFIAMSNYYYDQKVEYLDTLAAVRSEGHDLTAFMRFALRGIYLQSQRLLNAIQLEIRKELYWSFAKELFETMRTPRKRVIATRQLHVLRIVLDQGRMDGAELLGKVDAQYQTLRHAQRALVRDMSDLVNLGALAIEASEGRYVVSPRLDWPTNITAQEFYLKLMALPKAKTASGLPH